MALCAVKTVSLGSASRYMLNWSFAHLTQTVILGLAVSLLCVHECVADKVYQLPSFPCVPKQCC